MADFINTIEILGDDAVIDGIIDRSISGSFNDNTITAIGAYAFTYCKNLTSVCFPIATSIDKGAFRGSGLKAITPESFPFVTSIDYMYNSFVFGESALETVDWPSLANVEEGSIFISCKSLRSVNLPNWSNSTSTCQKMFLNCTSLTDVNLPKITAIYNNTFSYCTALKSVTLPSLTMLGWSSCQDSGLETIDLPVCTDVVNNACTNCTKLTAMILRKSDVVATLYDKNAFSNTPIASGTGYIYVPRALLSDNDATKDYRRATNWSNFAAQFRALEDYTVDGTITGELDGSKT